MTAVLSCLLMFLTLVLLSACGPEVKQPDPRPAPAIGPPPARAPAVREAPPKVTGEVSQHVIVTAGWANMREKPDTESKILQVLTKGTKLVVVSKGNQWYRVRMSSGAEGWVAESVVTPPRPD